jgi:hypothetical protein
MGILINRAKRKEEAEEEDSFQEEFQEEFYMFKEYIKYY